MKITTLAILVLILIGAANARIPQKGDIVSIMTTDDRLFRGIVENLGDGLLCINCTDESTAAGRYSANTPAVEMCLGIGCIESLLWDDPNAPNMFLH